MSKASPCPKCGAVIEPCREWVNEVKGHCGQWGCAYARHWRRDCPSPEAAEFRAGLAAKRERNALREPA